MNDDSITLTGITNNDVLAGDENKVQSVLDTMQAQGITRSEFQAVLKAMDLSRKGADTESITYKTAKEVFAEIREVQEEYEARNSAEARRARARAVMGLPPEK